MNFHHWRGQIIDRMRAVERLPKIGEPWRMENGVHFKVDAITGIPLGDPEPDYYVLAGPCKWNNGEVGHGASTVRLDATA